MAVVGVWREPMVAWVRVFTCVSPTGKCTPAPLCAEQFPIMYPNKVNFDMCKQVICLIICHLCRKFKVEGTNWPQRYKLVILLQMQYFETLPQCRENICMKLCETDFDSSINAVTFYIVN